MTVLLLLLLTDIDECLNSAHGCTEDSERCFNFDGGFTCRCRDGYQKDGNMCTGTALISLLFILAFQYASMNFHLSNQTPSA